MNAASLRGPFDFSAYLRLTLLVFVLPLAVLLPVRFGLGEYGRLALDVFLAGSALEVVFCLLLVFGRRRGLIQPARFDTLDFLIRLLIGLPFTVYLIVAAPYSVIGLLRFFPVFGHLLGGRRFRFALRYFFLFLLGGLLFAMLKDFPYPGRVQSVTLLTAGLLGLLFYGREVFARGREFTALQGELSRRRLHRRLDQVERRERRTLEGLMPAYQARLFREDRNLRPEGGDRLLFALQFPGIHDSLVDFSEAVDLPTREKGRDAFAAEWDRYISYILQRTGEQSLKFARKGEAFFGVRPLDREEDVREAIFRIFFEIMHLLRYSERTRKSLEHRGRVGWNVHCAIARGEAVGLPQAGGSPAWMMLGPGIRRIEKFLADPPVDRTNKDVCWLSAELSELAYPYFEEKSGQFYHGWYQPGYLKQTYARDEHGWEPADDFYDRIRYGGDRGDSP